MEAGYENDLAGTTISRYAVVDLIGSGGMGRVYRARDQRLQRDVAIKVLCRQVGSHPHRGQELVVEARALSRLCHPHVAAIYDFLTESQRDFIVMEFVPGSTLKDILAEGALPFAEVIRLGKQMMRGLGAAHAAQLVHCDIKPANLKVTSWGDLKILDFGLAQLNPHSDMQDVSTHASSGFGPAGTLPYMAPERLRGECADERSDIFSAGAVLYEMATGNQAFPQLKMAQVIDAILHQEPVAPSTINSCIPLAFDRLVNKAMKKWPPERHQTASELGDALESCSAARAHGTGSAFGQWLTGLLG